MCGRFVTPGVAEIERFWHIGRHNWRSPFAGLQPARYNVAPQQGKPQNDVPVIRADADGTLELTDLQWWLLPFWSKAPRIQYNTFNARIEGVATNPSFRGPFRQRRCLVPAKGWYEWQPDPDAGVKQPYYFHAADQSLLAFAGIWDRWQGDAETTESFAILVGDADRSVDRVHDRAPFIVAPGNQAAWLDGTLTNPEQIMTLLVPPAAGSIAFHRVSRAVGNARNEGPGLVVPE